MVVASLLLPVAAQGEGRYRVKMKTTTIAEDQQSGERVLCPGNEPVVSGGGFTNASLNARVELNTSNPLAADVDGKVNDGWEVFYDNVDSNGSEAKFTVYAICDKKAKESDYRYVISEPVPSPEEQQVGGLAECPNGEPAVGGGVRSSGFLPDEMHASTLAPAQTNSMDGPFDSWLALVFNASGGTADQSFNVYAICDKKTKASKYAYRANFGDTSDFSRASTTAKCQRKESLVGGGAGSGSSTEDRALLTTSAPVTRKGKATRWRATVNDIAGGASSVRFGAIAICRK